jgi:hypothetical protein
MPDRTTRTPPPRRRPSTRKYLTADAERIIADCYPGQVLAAVIERAVRLMAVRDGLLTAKTGRRRAATKVPSDAHSSPLAASGPVEAPRVLPNAPDGS